MEIMRSVGQPIDARERVKFCLDQLEKAKGFKNDLRFLSEVCTDLTLEEIIGALIASEQAFEGHDVIEAMHERNT